MNNGQPLKVGMQIAPTELLHWSSGNDKIRTILAGKQVYIFGPGSGAVKTNNYLIQALTNCFSLDVKSGVLAGRGDLMEKIPESLISDDQENQQILVRPVNKYLFPTWLYDPGNGNEFVLQLGYANRRSVIQKLQTSRDTIIVYQSDFFPTPGSGEPVSCTLGFYDKALRRTQGIVDFSPYFDSAQIMETLIRVFVQGNADVDELRLQKACYAEICLALGKPSGVDFKTIYEKIRGGYAPH